MGYWPRRVHIRREHAPGESLLLSFEAEQEWVPAAAGCQLCGGFPYSTKCDVSRQFGVCGCVVAAEMEQAACTHSDTEEGPTASVL